MGQATSHINYKNACYDLPKDQTWPDGDKGLSRMLQICFGSLFMVLAVVAKVFNSPNMMYFFGAFSLWLFIVPPLKGMIERKVILKRSKKVDCPPSDYDFEKQRIDIIECENKYRTDDCKDCGMNCPKKCSNAKFPECEKIKKYNEYIKV